MQALLADQVFVYSAMAILSFAITQGLKWAFVKPWTNKLKDGTESHERIRKAINSVIFHGASPFTLRYRLDRPHPSAFATSM